MFNQSNQTLNSFRNYSENVETHAQKREMDQQTGFANEITWMDILLINIQQISRS